MDIETRAALQVLFLPPLSTVIDGADDLNPSEEDMAAYQAWCDARIREELAATERSNAKVAAVWDETVERRPLPDNYKRAMIRTHYPLDERDSEDVVGLDKDGNIEIIDEGIR